MKQVKANYDKHHGTRSKSKNSGVLHRKMRKQVFQSHSAFAERKEISHEILLPSHESVAAAASLSAKCIITPTASGATARVVSKFKPEAMIVGVTPNEEALRRMQIFRGVYPIKSIPYHSTEEICEEAINLTKAKGLVEAGDIVVVTAGIPSPRVKKVREGMSNMMRIAIVE